MDTFLQQLVNGLTTGSVYAVVALGYTMVYGIIQLINFAHGEVVLIGPACAIPVCMIVGYAMERLAYRPLRRAPRLAPLITAIGVSIILQHLALLVWTRNVLAFPQIIPTTGYTFLGATITNIQIMIIVVCVTMMAGLALLVYR